jgi:hypothetical protein
MILSKSERGDRFGRPLHDDSIEAAPRRDFVLDISPAGD